MKEFPDFWRTLLVVALRSLLAASRPCAGQRLPLSRLRGAPRLVRRSRCSPRSAGSACVWPRPPGPRPQRGTARLHRHRGGVRDGRDQALGRGEGGVPGAADVPLRPQHGRDDLGVDCAAESLLLRRAGPGGSSHHPRPSRGDSHPAPARPPHQPRPARAPDGAGEGGAGELRHRRPGRAHRGQVQVDRGGQAGPRHGLPQVTIVGGGGSWCNCGHFICLMSYISH